MSQSAESRTREALDARMRGLSKTADKIATDVPAIFAGGPDADALRNGMRERVAEMRELAEGIETDARRMAASDGFSPAFAAHLLEVADRAAQAAALAENSVTHA